MREPTDSIVFVVVPVFERLEHTLACVRQLKAQRGVRVEIVVVDGGSTDGSVDALRAVDGITLIADVGEQWWAGATWFGIEHALQRGADGDHVLLLNDDTTFDVDLVATLVAESLAHDDAVVAPIVTDLQGNVVNSGVWIDWPSYDIVQRADDAGPAHTTWPVDALEGRGTLVPIAWIRKAGNVAKDRLPHYAADYEFTLRLARHGAPVLMTNRTSLAVDWNTARMAAYWEAASLRRLWWEATSRRSFVNLATHWTLIGLARPARGRRLARASMVRRRVVFALRRLPRPAWWTARRRVNAQSRKIAPSSAVVREGE